MAFGLFVKFILPTDTAKLKTIETVFDNMGAVIRTTPSKTESILVFL